MRHAVVCVGDGGISGLATVRSLGRRGVPVHVVALAGSAQIASASRYCRSHAEASDLASLPEALRGFPAGALLYVDNDPMLEALAPHAGELAQRFALVDPLADAPKLTDKAYQMRIAQKAGIAIPRSWEDLLSLKSPKRLIAKPVAGRADFKALIAASAAELAAALRSRAASPADAVVQEFVLPRGEPGAVLRAERTQAASDPAGRRRDGARPGGRRATGARAARSAPSSSSTRATAGTTSSSGARARPTSSRSAGAQASTSPGSPIAITPTPRGCGLAALPGAQGMGGFRGRRSGAVAQVAARARRLALQA